jgi:hypothetical protein|tara:strand:+ start:74 stop:367 length:294 start_codon:yes stop_codon:yes gene_type:complete
MIIIKNLFIAIFLVGILSSCAQNAVLLGPAYTLATSGNVYQAGFTYGTNEIITKTTGKSTFQNFKDALALKKEDTDFEKLVKKNIEGTRKKLNLVNQ